MNAISNFNLLTPVLSAQDMMAAHSNARNWISASLVEKVDFDNIPGTDKNKKVLLKSGVDKIIIGFRLATRHIILESEIDHDRVIEDERTVWVDAPDQDPGNGYPFADGQPLRQEAKLAGLGRSKKVGNQWTWQVPVKEAIRSKGLYRYVIKIELMDSTGTRVGEGIGICSSMEAKYIRAPRDAEHTIQAMAHKRARQQAVISTLGLSDLFGEEDVKGPEPKEHDHEPAAETRQAETKPQPISKRAQAMEIIKSLGMDQETEREWYKLFNTTNEASQALIDAKAASMVSIDDLNRWYRQTFEPQTPVEEKTTELHVVTNEAVEGKPDPLEDPGTPPTADDLPSGDLAALLEGRLPQAKIDWLLERCVPINEVLKKMDAGMTEKMVDYVCLKKVDSAPAEILSFMDEQVSKSTGKGGAK